MTCVAAVVSKGVVTMAADSAGVSGWQLAIRSDPKVFRRGEFVIGFTSSFRMGQLLRHVLQLPVPPRGRRSNAALARFMTVEFVGALRACLKEHGWMTSTNGQESGGQFMVGVHGRLFTVESDFQVAEERGDFAAVGCGADLARGALFALRNSPAKQRVITALKAAEYGSAGVRRPFVMEVA